MVLMKHLILALFGLILTVTSAAAQNGYRIKPGDSLAIEVLQDATLNRSTLVLPDGTIAFPYVGTLQVGGQSLTQVQQALATGLASNFASPPTVFVSVNSVFTAPPRTGTAAVPVTISIYFTGEVNAPGLKPVAPGTTFLQAIAQSGGFTKFAALKRVQLRRSDMRGQQNVYVINYRALSNGARLNRDIVLQEGDVILVPERRLFE